MIIRLQFRMALFMMKDIGISRLAAGIRRHLMVAAPLVLVACDPGATGRKEIFIEAVPTEASAPLVSHAALDRKGASQSLHLDFEDGPYYVGPDSSLLYRGGALTFVRDQGYFKPGSVLVSNRTASWHGPMLVLPPLEGGRAYSASVWIKLLETEQPSAVKLEWMQVAEGALTSVTLAEIQAEPLVWQKLEGEFISSGLAGSDINVLSVEVDKAEIKYLMDDVIVTYAELSADMQAAAAAARPKVTNMIVNGDVELGLEPWIHQGGVISRSSAYAHKGNYSLQIAGRKQEWNAPMMPVKGLQDEKHYRFSIFVRMDDGEPSTNVRLTMRRVTSGQTTFLTLGGGTASSAGWTEITGVFSASNASQSENVSVYLEALHPTASYFVDTLTVEEIAAP